MAFNGSSGSSSTNVSSGNGGNQDGPLNKRLCTGKENNEAGINNNRVCTLKFLPIACIHGFGFGFFI